MYCTYIRDFFQNKARFVLTVSPLTHNMGPNINTLSMYLCIHLFIYGQ